ncbi:BREX-1 system adenine-specific DNA-methyltransferase PglX [Paenarthrobacter nicotinovorans]|uniref:site-specific DNA-methyltransferase (adenine-specific) n=1 Tax=Paenarthrobacter nicotinovorans TaxID=29320 RepID=A0ABV0GMS2_PAENI
METAPLKTFAIWARTALIREVSARISVVLASEELRQEQPSAVAALEKAVNAAGGSDKGRDTVADKVAYTWFNRIIALRFMDAKAYTGIGVVSPERGREGGQPEVLAEAKRGNIDSTVVTNKRTAETVTSLLNGMRRSDDPQGEAYALLLAEYCRHWNRSMPFMFEREGDYTELLIPANLLADDSVMARAVDVLTEDVCQDVEVIGWLYQFYISERRGEVVAGFKKNRKAGAAEIPAATQLFTPHWLVRYLVENSLGRLWLLNRPSSRLADQMDYYLAPVDEEMDYLKISRPEELKIIDPACGSGHMLTYAFDLLYAIYEEEGYAPSDIPSLILTNNLYGTEIDPRAGALAAFALAMKARACQRTFFAKDVELNIRVLEPISFTPAELDALVTDDDNRADEEAFWNQFEYADTFGSLIQPREDLLARLRSALDANASGDDLLLQDQFDRAARVILQADYLSQRYSIVVANPPYMGSGNMGAKLSAWVKDTHPDEKQDLYACFVTRGSRLVRSHGLVAMITGDTWMTIKTFEGFRKKLFESHTFRGFLHLHDVSNHPDIFGANAAFVLSKGHTSRYQSMFVYLEPLSAEAKRTQLLEAIRSPQSPWAFRVRGEQLEKIPGMPIVYRLSNAMLGAFARGKPLGKLAAPVVGLQTGENNRYIRFWWEVSRNRSGFGYANRAEARASGRKWFPYNKGGEYRKWWGNQDYVVNWEDDGRELAAFKPRSVIRNPGHYFSPSVSWSKISSGDPAFRAYPEGFIFDHAGTSIFAHDDLTRQQLLGICNSSVALELLKAMAPTLNFEVGIIAKLPVVLPDSSGPLNEVVEALVTLARRDSNQLETSWEFAANPLVGEGNKSLSEIVASHYEDCYATILRGQELEQRNNRIVAEMYGLVDEVSTSVSLNKISLNRNVVARYGEEERIAKFNSEAVGALISYAIGCMFGRYSLEEPGLILSDQGDSLQNFLTKVPNPSFLPDKDNVIPIVDGEWFEDDIVARFRQFLRAAFGEELFEENLRFVADALGVKDVRDYFVKSFYKDHWQRYKKRPIYWMFSSPRGSFNALVYVHRYTPSTVSTVLNEYLREFKGKLDASRQHHERLAAGTGTPRQQAAAQKEVDRLRNVLLELDEYEHDVLYPLATQQVQIDLDDGVKANYPKLGAALKKIPGLEASDE